MSVRDLILSATKLPEEQVPLPELGPSVFVTVRGMTGAQRSAFEQGCFEGKGKNREFSIKNVREKMVVACCYDGAVKAFTDADIEAIGSVRADIIDRLFGVAQKLCGMKPEDVEDLGRPLPMNPITSISSSGSLENSAKPSENS